MLRCVISLVVLGITMRSAGIEKLCEFLPVNAGEFHTHDTIKSNHSTNFLSSSSGGHSDRRGSLYAGWLSSTSLATGVLAALLLAGVLGASPVSAQQVWDSTTDGNAADNGSIDGGSGVWDAATTPNFTSDGGTTNEVYANPGNVIFSVGTGADTVTVNGTVDINDIDFQATGYIVTGGTLNTGAADRTITVDGATAEIGSVVTGTGGLTKAGTGILTLSGANTYTGDTTVSAGTLNLGADDVIADGSNLVIIGGTFDLNNNVETVHNLSGTGGDIATGGTLGHLIVNQDVASTYSGGFSGVSGFNSRYFQKLGAGTLTLDGTSTVAGGGRFSVLGGRLVVQNGNAIGDKSSLVILNIAEVELLSDETIGMVLGAAGSQVILNANTLTIAGASLPSRGTSNGDITGTGGIVYNAAGNTQKFSTALTYTGSTAVQAGVLDLTGAGALASTSIAVNGGELQTDGGALAAGATVTVSGTGLFDVNGNESITSLVSNAAGASTTIDGGTLTTGTTTLSNGTISGTGALVSTGAIAQSGGDLNVSTVTTAGFQMMGGTVGAGATITSSADYDLQSGTVNGVLAGAVGVNKTTAGTVTLAGANAYTGTTTVSVGTLEVGNDAALGATSGLLNVGGGTLDLGGFTVTKMNTFAQNATIQNGTLNVTTGIQMQSANISAVISGNGDVISAGPGTSTLSADNTTTGVLIVNRGTINLTGSVASNFIRINDTNPGDPTVASLQVDGSSLLDTAEVTINNSGNLTLTGDERIGALLSNSTTATVTLGANTLTTGQFFYDRFAGVISGTGGLTKEGINTFVLFGTNTYTGATTINNGTLQLDGGAAIADTSAVTVAAGAFLEVTANETIGSLASAGEVSLSSTTLTTGDATDTTVSGSIYGGGGSLVKQGTGTMVLSGTNLYTGTTTVSAGTLRLAGGAAIVDTGDVTVNNTAVLNVAATETINSLTNTGTVTIDDGQTLSMGVIDNNVGGIINVGVGSTLQGTANTLNNAGTTNVGTNGVVTDAGNVNNLATGVINFNGPGGVATLFSGTNIIDNAGAINVVSGNVNATGDFAHQATGVVNMQNGATDSVVALTGNLAASTGSRMVLDVDLSNGTADGITVSGTANGETIIALDLANNGVGVDVTSDALGAPLSFSGGGFFASPLNLIDGNGGTITAQGGTGSDMIATSGLVDYTLENNAAGDLFISSRINGASTVFAALPGMIEAISTTFYKPADTFTSCYSHTSDDTPFSSWARVNAGEIDTKTNGSATIGGASNSVSAELNTTYRGFQAGFDGSLCNLEGSDVNVHIGFTGGMLEATSRQTDSAGLSADLSTVFVGAYAAYTRGAFRADVSGRYDSHSFDLSHVDPNIIAPNTNVDGYTASATFTAAYQIDVNEQFSVTPVAGLTISRTSLDSFAIQGGTGTADINDKTSAIGFVGFEARMPHVIDEKTTVTPFLTAKAFNQFVDTTNSTFSISGVDVNVETSNSGAWGQIGAGVEFALLPENKETGYGAITGALSIDGQFGDQLEGWGANAKIRVQF